MIFSRQLLPGLAVLWLPSHSLCPTLPAAWDYLFPWPVSVDVHQLVPRMGNAQGSANHTVEQVFRLWKFL